MANAISRIAFICFNSGYLLICEEAFPFFTKVTLFFDFTNEVFDLFRFRSGFLSNRFETGVPHRFPREGGSSFTCGKPGGGKTDGTKQTERE